MRRERFPAPGKTMGAAFWAVLSGACLAGACASSPARQEAGEERIPVQEKKSSAAELLEQLPSHDDVAVSVRIGIEHWDTGEITLTLHGSGEATVLQRVAGKENRFTGQVDDERLGRIGADLARQGFTSIRAREGDRMPDDVPVIFEIERNGERLHHAELWHGDRYQDKALDSILDQVDALISELTNGKLPFGG